MIKCPCCGRPGVPVYEVTTNKYYVECFFKYCNLTYTKVRGVMNNEIKEIRPYILAKDAEIDVFYLTSSGNRIVVKKKNMSGDIMTSVTVVEDGWEGAVHVSAETELYSYDIEEHNTLSNQIKNKRGKSMSNLEKTTSMPRSKTIDIELAKAASAGVNPDFDAIATAVIAAGSAAEEDRSKVKNQIKARSNWYATGKKVNPAQTQTVNAEQAPPPPTDTTTL